MHNSKSIIKPVIIHHEWITQTVIQPVVFILINWPCLITIVQRKWNILFPLHVTPIFLLGSIYYIKIKIFWRWKKSEISAMRKTQQPYTYLCCFGWGWKWALWWGLAGCGCYTCTMLSHLKSSIFMFHRVQPRGKGFSV